MSRITRLILAGLVVAAVATRLPAQATSKSASASVTAHIDGALTLSTTQNLAFGSWFTNSGVIFSNTIPTSAQWAFSINPGTTISVTFTVPTSLAGSPSGSMAFSCGATSANISASATPGQTGNPATGFPSVAIGGPPGPGQGTIVVGQSGPNPSDACSIDPSTATPFRDYSGALVATITVL